MRRRERGFALLVVLWSVVLLAVLGTGITAAGRGALLLAANLRGGAEAEAAADGAVYEAATRLLDPGRPWVADGRAYTTDIGRVRVTVRIEDEAGKVNPNTASPQLLAALLRQVGAERAAAERVAAAMLAWRTRGGPDGAAAYRAAGLGYAPPRAPFESVGELGAVLGMSPALLARLRPYVSLSAAGEPDAGSASVVVRQAMREATGLVPPASRPAMTPRTVTVLAEAEGLGGSRFVRRATVRLGSGPREASMSVLEWSVPDQ